MPFKVTSKGCPNQVAQITNRISMFKECAKRSPGMFMEGDTKETALRYMEMFRDQAFEQIQENYEFWRKQIEQQKD